MNRAEVECWLVGPEAVVDLGCLTPEERTRAGRMRSSSAGVRFARGRAVLRHVVAHHLDVALESLRLDAPGGMRPRLLGVGALQVSLAHAGDHVAVALAHAPVGVDIERVGGHRRVPTPVMRAGKLRMVRRLASPGGMAETAWVVHEAALKADGIGLGFPLDDVVVAPFGPGLRVELIGRSAWGVTVFGARGRIVGAVAVDGPPPVVSLHQDEPLGLRSGPGAGRNRPGEGRCRAGGR